MQPSVCENEAGHRLAGPALLDVAAKSMAILSLATYIVGLLITNFYLRQYGAFQLEPLRTEYVVTGVVWFVLSMTTLLMIVEATKMVLGKYRDWCATRGASKWYVVFFGIPVVAAISCFIVAELGALGVRNLWSFRVLTARCGAADFRRG
jgi:hypothetical protein